MPTTPAVHFLQKHAPDHVFCPVFAGLPDALTALHNQHLVAYRLFRRRKQVAHRLINPCHDPVQHLPVRINEIHLAAVIFHFLTRFLNIGE